ncbi:ABC transporter ATP-binding protein [Variovorax ginsengisoli]|uniref:ABC-type sugar transport system ATPase subunit n=1 Tax=Variovorax ginsengisoli TaxID=363844 RepID=A0ABT9S4L3_9BURK|nr:sn-glycerol-3-phosphate ABC transporter ATP-binding protein UgpC [Variovorax ginsengisoli]MDP9899288.1 ABC-type sugar transport system ATPase subunit [Variovorax ginsengisoli]
MTQLSIRNVVKRYGDAEVIRRLSFDIQPGEFAVFVGPSGCGKSTLLRMIAGLEEFHEGEIAIGGRVVNALAPSQRDIAMVFQDYALYPHMTVRSNITLSLKVAGMAKAEIQRKLDHVAGVLQIGHLLERKPRELSGGQRQRVAMGRAMVRDPKIFLFDEPLSNLDAKLRVDMRAEIKQLHQRLGATMVYVTHDQVEAMTLADRIVVLRDGRIEQVGTPAELYAQPVSKFVAGFIGSPAMNLLSVDIVQGNIALPGSSRWSPEGVASHVNIKADLGLRPEHLTLSDDGPGLQGRITLIEPLGADTLVTVAVADTPLVARLPGDTVLQLDAPIRLAFNPAKAVLFGTDGLRLGAAAAAQTTYVH